MKLRSLPELQDLLKFSIIFLHLYLGQWLHLVRLSVRGSRTGQENSKKRQNTTYVG